VGWRRWGLLKKRGFRPYLILPRIYIYIALESLFKSMAFVAMEGE
jgi:hypothetical protein